MHIPGPRTSGEDGKLSQAEFHKRFENLFIDSTFDTVREEISHIESIAWNNYHEGRKAPRTMRAGKNFKDPNYDLSIDWINAKSEIDKAQYLFENHPDNHVLIINGSDRNEHTCPGEYSKSKRLIEHAKKELEKKGVVVQVLNLSEMTAEYGKIIHPCKGCVSTAMPLCHWPCSCYPNHSLGQVNDWMNDIYPMWVRAHGVMIVTPVYWHQAPSALKLMIDRLVCADGGNPDPSSTQGKKAKLAKEIEMKGWDYPRHLEGRIFSIIVHGDTIDVDSLKDNLSGWLEEMSLISAGYHANLSRFIGYYEEYATSHEALDKDKAIKREVENAASNLYLCVKDQREKKLQSLIPELPEVKRE
jgi:multimeric flavodoxin WrbA